MCIRDRIRDSIYETQFIEIIINFEKNLFGLNQASKKVIDGNIEIDGVAGATITSKGTVDMMNSELKKYKNYLR